ncbi:DUF445 family protein [Halanaerobium praevalens]|uniref:DUF445 family protein n=1 Tax=Halanaerobium praevalens (strain ATCC 33744 / DSM 2228 / GSL) TaxID=572479 RepID=E3DMM3_HALPG|nr:DUF445 family protein [Halanaerobium praevalens]ADO76347.1 protein of unknown function DUF445 [Halanaerobium praevalens DSM 2228]
MALDLLAIISAAGTGAVTGYLTNNLALKMIFKEYGPLGGVVVKTKTEFIESISKLVEKDLINHQTLAAQFSAPAFQTNFKQTTADFLNIYLVKHSQKLKLAEISGFEKNYEFLAEAASKSSAEAAIKTAKKLEEKELKEIISESKQQQLLVEAKNLFVKKACSNSSLEKIMLNFVQQLQEQSLRDLIDQNIYLELKEIMKNLINYLQINQSKLQNSSKKELLTKLKDLFKLDQTGRELIEQIQALRLSDLIKSEAELKEITAEAEISKLIKEILVNLKIEIQNSEICLADLMTEGIKNDFRADLAVLTKAGTKEILAFVDSESENLNQLILTAVEAEIEASSGFQAMSRQGIYSKYKENIEEYGLPITHLQTYLKSKIKSDQQKLVENLFEKIKNININRFLDQVDLDSLSLKLEQLFFDFYAENNNQRLTEIFSADLFEQKKLTDKLLTLSLNFASQISDDPQAVEVLIDYLMSLKLKTFVKSEQIKADKNNLVKPLAEFLLEKDSFLKDFAAFLNQNFFEILSKEFQKSQSELETEVENHFKSQVDKIGSKKVESIVQLVPNQPGSVADLTESITTFFYNNLPELLEGQVAKAAAANLNQLSDQEVQKAIEDFMGKELKPITYLGALLGALAGIIFSASGAEMAILQSAPLWLEYLSSALLYGGVGWLTNVLAIWMIFHPYQEYNILGAKIPFTPGVVAKNRSRFADSMGKFVEKELLQAETAAEIIENNREAIKSRILAYFAAKDYQQLFNLINSKKDLLAAALIKKMKQLLKHSDNSDFENLVSKVEKRLEKLLVEKVDDLDFETEIKSYLKAENNSLVELNYFLTSQFSLDKLINSLTGSYSFELNSLQLKKIIANKELYPLFRFILPSLLNKEINFKLKDYVLDILKQDSKLYLDQGLDLLWQKEADLAKAINFKKDEIIEKEKEKKGGLLKNTMISGAIYMADLDQFVNSVVARVFAKLKNNYFEQKREKLESHYFKLLENLAQKDLNLETNFNLTQLLASFFASEKGAKLLKEVLYLSDDLIADLIELILKEDRKDLLALNFELQAEAVEYLIQEQLSLEQKLQLLLLIKDLLTAKNLAAEIRNLLEKLDLEILTKEIKLLVNNLKLIENENLKSDLLAELKKNGADLLETEAFTSWFHEYSTAEISKLVQKIARKMDRDSLEDLLILFIEAGIDSFKNNSEALLQSLELKNLTAAEVRKMDPAEIESLFNDFAGKYFNHLKEYGWFGGVFGVLQLLIRTII